MCWPFVANNHIPSNNKDSRAQQARSMQCIVVDAKVFYAAGWVRHATHPDKEELFSVLLREFYQRCLYFGILCIQIQAILP